MTVSLEPSYPDPGAVGDTVLWEAPATGAAPGTLWRRFRVRPANGTFRTVVDYGPEAGFAWTPADREGVYEIEVSLRNRDTGEETTASRFYEVLRRAGPGDPPGVFPTRHPLVQLYSAPPCPAGGRMRVEFSSTADDRVATPARACDGAGTMNFLLAGMRSGQVYTVRHVVEAEGRETPGPVLEFATPPYDVYINRYKLRTPASPGTGQGVLLQSTTTSTKATASDLEGNLLWYYGSDLNFLTRPVAGGTFLGIVQQPSRDNSYQVVREFDLTGTTVRETNAARVSEQLRDMGKREITAFHHEADALPGGRLLVLAATEQILTGVQGPGAVDVLGEMILVLDANLQVEWAWDALDHLDPARAAVLGETCGPTGGGCPPFYKAPRANDWLHANSVKLAPDGNLVMSIRHMDWVIKIDYANGKGSGDILWRLGQDGDFKIISSDPDPWFSHQHDATILPGSETLLTVFDNGNTRYSRDPTAKSRGQMYRLDEENHTATLVYNADLGAYSSALGSAQLLPNGNFHFDVGWIGGTASRSVETDAQGRIVFDIEADASAYRTFRLPSLY